jgi:cytochrome c-type biogenesis protein
VNSVGELVFSGPLLIALPIAIAAGFLAFASPCVLPLVPGYLGYVSGFSGSSSESTRPTLRLVIGVLLFIAGFSSVFVSFSIVFASLGAALIAWVDVILRIAGLLIILMGFVFIGQVSFHQASPGCSQWFSGGPDSGGGIRFGLGALYWADAHRREHVGF